MNELASTSSEDGSVATASASSAIPSTRNAYPASAASATSLSRDTPPASSTKPAKSKKGSSKRPGGIHIAYADIHARTPQNPYIFPAVKYAVNTFYDEITLNGGDFKGPVADYLLNEPDVTEEESDGVKFGLVNAAGLPTLLRREGNHVANFDSHFKPIKRILHGLEKIFRQEAGWDIWDAYRALEKGLNTVYREDKPEFRDRRLNAVESRLSGAGARVSYILL
jgi:hypothetical protein